MTAGSAGGVLDAAVARVGLAVVAVSGPPGAGKTGVLLALIADGATPVAFERARVTPGAVVRDDRAIRVRAHHLPLLGRAVRLSPLERARLRCGALAMHLPWVGARIGRRCFVDLAPSAVRAWASAAEVDLHVRLDPSSADEAPTPALRHPAGSPSAGPVDLAPAVTVGTRGRSVEEVAAAIGETARDLRWSRSR